MKKTYPIIIEIKAKPLGYTTVHDEIYNLPLKDVEKIYN
jgi:hypothetical protein